MKKLALACVLLLLFTACSQIDAIREVNDNSNFPFPLALPEAELNYGNEYEKGMGYGGYSLEGEGIWISISGWPDVLDDYHVTGCRVTGGDWSVFGIKVGDSLEDAAAVLEKNGYKKAASDEGWGENTYYKYRKVRIILSAIEGRIYEIQAMTIVTNKENVAF